MPSQFFTMSGEGGNSVTLSINNIASVEDQGNRIVVHLVQPINVTVQGATTMVSWCEITSDGMALFRTWFAQHHP